MGAVVVFVVTWHMRCLDATRCVRHDHNCNGRGPTCATELYSCVIARACDAVRICEDCRSDSHQSSRTLTRQTEEHGKHAANPTAKALDPVQHKKLAAHTCKPTTEIEQHVAIHTRLKQQASDEWERWLVFKAGLNCLLQQHDAYFADNEALKRAHGEAG